jgi:hypothetical protein
MCACACGGSRQTESAIVSAAAASAHAAATEGGLPCRGRSCLACCDAEGGGKVGRLSAPAYAHALSPREAHPQRRGAARGCDGRVESVRLACARDGARRTESEAFKDDLRCGARAGGQPNGIGHAPPSIFGTRVPCFYNQLRVNYINSERDMESVIAGEAREPRPAGAEQYRYTIRITR